MITRRSLTSKSSGATVDLIPMIDVVFQLILFFLVSTTFAILPAISVTAQTNGTIWFNDTKVSLEELEISLSNFDTGEVERSKFPIMLEADEMVTNGTIVKIFDVLRKAGFSAVNLRTTALD